VVSGEAASRVLRIGDPQGLLPATKTVEAAITTIQGRLAVEHSLAFALNGPTQ
jgi:hypothetical protein